MLGSLDSQSCPSAVIDQSTVGKVPLRGSSTLCFSLLQVQRPTIDVKGLRTRFYNQLQRRIDVEDLLVQGLPKVCCLYSTLSPLLSHPGGLRA